MALAFKKRNRSAFTNFLRSKYEMLTAAEKVSTLPYYISIDPSDTCQLLCPTCPTGIENESKKQKNALTTLYRSDRKKLSIELFDSVLEELADRLFLIMFYNYGEPLLNPRLHEFIAKATDRDIATEVHSNLSLPLSDQRIEQLLSAGIGRLSASIDGFSQEAYEVHRVGGDVKLVRENLTRLAKTRDRLGLDTELLYKFLIFKHNEHEIEDARRFSEDIGVTFLAGDAFISDPSWLPSHREHEQPYYSVEDTHAFIQSWKDAGREDYFFEHESVVAPFWSILPKQFDSTLPRTCSWHYGFSVISAGGPVAPCCGVAKDKDDFGTVVPGQTSFTEIWNNDLFTKSRMVMGGKPTDGLDHVDTVCMRCYLPKMVHHIYNDQDRLVAQRFGEVFGESEPEMAKAFVLLGDGFSSTDAAGFIAHYEQNLSMHASQQRETLHNALPQIALITSDRQQNEMSSAHATEILKDFGILISGIGLNGSKVFDESLLKHPKGDSLSAIVIILNGQLAADQQAFAREAAAVLAFFQPGVGEAAVAMDSIRSDQRTWRSVVEAEMQKNGREIASRTQRR
jgi:MoaA/NifB/PqqE/SkfB family radical SAM enzyme